MNDWITPLPRPAAPAQPLAVPNSLAIGSFAYINRRQWLEERWRYIVGKLAEWKRAHPGTGFPREWLNEKDTIDNDLRLMPLDEKNRVQDSLVNPAGINTPPSKARTPLEAFQEYVDRLNREGGDVRAVIEALDLCAKAIPQFAERKKTKIEPFEGVIIEGDLAIDDIRPQLKDKES